MPERSLRGARRQALYALAICWADTGCSAHSSNANSAMATSGSTADASASEGYVGEFSVTLPGFLDYDDSALGDAGPAAIPSDVYVVGQIYDGPYPEPLVSTELPTPSGATAGCAVYSVASPSCVNIGGCGASSRDVACAALANSNPCVCVATDTCLPNPTEVSAGTVTVSGIADTSGARAFQMVNLSNSYQMPPTENLVYPGFAEGDTITVSATGGDCAPFDVTAKGIAPLKLTNEAYNLLKDTSSADSAKYQPLTINWITPALVNNASIQVEIDISHHAGTVGYLACDADDTGSLTISAGLVTQLVALGNIGGFPELTVTRTSLGSTEIAQGEVDLTIQSVIEPKLTIEGYTSCLADTDCPAGQVCNRGIKLCQGA